MPNLQTDQEFSADLIAAFILQKILQIWTLAGQSANLAFLVRLADSKLAVCESSDSQFRNSRTLTAKVKI